MSLPDEYRAAQLLHIIATIQDVTNSTKGQAILLHESKFQCYLSEGIFKELHAAANLLPREMRMTITVEKADMPSFTI